jgi:hypothetical protein
VASSIWTRRDQRCTLIRMIRNKHVASEGSGVGAPEAAVNNLKKRIDQSVSGKFGGKAAKCICFRVKSPISKKHIVALLDPKDWNITVRNAAELFSKANEVLVAEFARRFSLDKADAQFFDFAVSLRNYLGHRSDGSRAELKAALRGFLEAANAPLAAKLVNIGTYLKTKNSTGATRAVIFAQRLISISEKL